MVNRFIGLVIANFQMVPPLLVGSDFMALLPSRVAPHITGLACFPVPVPIAGFSLHLAWHQRRSQDIALRTWRKD